MSTQERLSFVDAPCAAERRGYDFLSERWRAQGGVFPCLNSSSRRFEESHLIHPESFTAMVILDLVLTDPLPVALRRSILWELSRELDEEGLFFFFKEHERLPADADCTSIGLSLLARSGLLPDYVAHQSLDRILSNVDTLGVICTYFDPTGERDGIVDPVVCTNALFLASLYGREEEASATIAFLERLITGENLEEGSRYYPSCEALIYFLTRLVHTFPQRFASWRPHLTRHVRARLSAEPWPMDVAIRVIAGDVLGVDVSQQRRELAALQQADGGWPVDAFFRYGRSGIFFGNREMTTGFALRALSGRPGWEQMKRPPEEQQVIEITSPTQPHH